MVYSRDIFILYGSQTGNAEDIAKDLYSKITERNFEGILPKCLTLNSVKKVCLKETALLVILICSTTGNGDSPENADQWWRSIKLRSVVSFRI